MAEIRINETGELKIYDSPLSLKNLVAVVLPESIPPVIPIFII